MDSDALETFLAIHRAGGFSSAADKLHRSQPAISRRMALLEEELGAPLFERVAGGVVLSQAGRVLLPHAERVAAALKGAGDAMTALRDGDAGPASVAAVGTLASTNLTKVLKRFAARYPNAEIALTTATSDEVSDRVRRGEATIGLRYFDDRSNDLVARALKPERLVVVCAPAHRLANKKVPKLLALRDERWLAFPERREGGEVGVASIVAQFLARNVAKLDIAAVDSLTAQKRLIEAGFGVGLLPESAIAEERKAKTLASIAVGDLDAANPVFVVTRADGYLSPAAQKLLVLLADEFGAR